MTTDTSQTCRTGGVYGDDGVLEVEQEESAGRGGLTTQHQEDRFLPRMIRLSMEESVKVVVQIERRVVWNEKLQRVTMRIGSEEEFGV
jgi:hypothetical protein